MENIENESLDKTSPKILEELKSPPKESTDKGLTTDDLKKAAKDRAKKRPILQKIVQVLKREKEPFRELIINSEALERRVALLIDGVLDKFDVERSGEDRLVGAIFKGKIQNSRTWP